MVFGELAGFIVHRYSPCIYSNANPLPRSKTVFLIRPLVADRDSRTSLADWQFILWPTKIVSEFLSPSVSSRSPSTCL